VLEALENPDQFETLLEDFVIDADDIEEGEDAKKQKQKNQQPRSRKTEADDEDVGDDEDDLPPLSEGESDEEGYENDDDVHKHADHDPRTERTELAKVFDARFERVSATIIFTYYIHLQFS
jgi:hypothetical protein